jgi:site-specific DNA-adenine methylase
MKAEYSTIYVANPTSILREIDSEQFDLVYLDPPYFESNVFSKRDTKSPYRNFEEYLQYTTGIILQSHRVLKTNGSILVRNSPLSPFNARLFLDRIFGKRNYRAEIIWGRRIVKGLGGAVPHANFDNVFFYSKSDDFIYHEPSQELSKEEIKRRYKWFF